MGDYRPSSGIIPDAPPDDQPAMLPDSQSLPPGSAGLPPQHLPYTSTQPIQPHPSTYSPGSPFPTGSPFPPSSPFLGSDRSSFPPAQPDPYNYPPSPLLTRGFPPAQHAPDVHYSHSAAPSVSFHPQTNFGNFYPSQGDSLPRGPPGYSQHAPGSESYTPVNEPYTLGNDSYPRHPQGSQQPSAAFPPNRKHPAYPQDLPQPQGPGPNRQQAPGTGHQGPGSGNLQDLRKPRAAQGKVARQGQGKRIQKQDSYPATNGMGLQGNNPCQVKCPLCKSTIVTEVVKEPGTLTYVMCCILFLCTGICCLLPFLISSCMDTVHKCPRCGFAISGQT